jgi:hypothetical protein
MTALTWGGKRRLELDFPWGRTYGSDYDIGESNPMISLITSNAGDGTNGGNVEDSSSAPDDSMNVILSAGKFDSDKVLIGRINE